MIVAGVFVSYSVADADWGGTLSGSMADTRADSSRSSTVDQQYSVFTTGALTPQVNYLLSLRYRHLQSGGRGMPSLWQTELRPSGELRWATPLYTLRGEYTQRLNREEQRRNELTGKSGLVFFQTNLLDLPRIHGSGEWTTNLNDLELIGYNTRSRALGMGANYSTRQLSLVYNFHDRLTRNENTKIDRLSQSHQGRLDHVLRVFERAVSLETSYQIVGREEKDRDRNNGSTLIVLPATAGLYGDDPTPEFDALTVAAGLVDGVMDAPASPSYDLSGATFHNFGLDFGAPVQIDHVYLYTDTLANPDMRWSIWTGSDNQTWTRIDELQTAPFTPVFNRYEFSFAPVETRYLKLVVEPALAIWPVYVTELRGLIARGAEHIPERSTDQRGSVQLRIQPRKWFSLGVGGDLARLSSTQTSLARSEEGLQGTVRIAPGTGFEVSSRVARTGTRYPDSGRAAAITELGNFAVRWTINAALAATGTLDRRSELQDAVRLRRSDAARLDVRTVILPALRGTTQLVYIEDHRYDNVDTYFTRSFGQLLEGEPTPRSTMSADYRFYDMSARFHAVPRYRETGLLRAGYRLTGSVAFIGEGTLFREASRESRSMVVGASWSTTPKLTLTTTMDRLTGTEIAASTQWTLQGYFRWTSRTDVNFAYSLTQQERAFDTRTARIGLNSSF